MFIMWYFFYSKKSHESRFFSSHGIFVYIYKVNKKWQSILFEVLNSTLEDLKILLSIDIDSYGLSATL